MHAHLGTACTVGHIPVPLKELQTHQAAVLAQATYHVGLLSGPHSAQATTTPLLFRAGCHDSPVSQAGGPVWHRSGECALWTTFSDEQHGMLESPQVGQPTQVGWHTVVSLRAPIPWQRMLPLALVYSGEFGSISAA